ncbi:Thioredoxin reductase [Diplonema papillatum]|nr:Thioredoxin reductase [Diplonema papillatum]
MRAVVAGVSACALVLLLGMASQRESAAADPWEAGRVRESPPSLAPLPPRFTSGLADAAAERIVVVGGGVAGLSCALYTARSGLRPLVIADGNGELAMSGSVQNYPGVLPSPGTTILSAMAAQATEAGATRIRGRVVSVNPDTYPFEVTAVAPNALRNDTDVFTVRAWSVILATGATPLWPALPNEGMYQAKNLHTCHLCDGFLYVGRPVVVIGGGETALEAALYLAKTSSKVYIVHRSSSFRASDSTISRLHREASGKIVAYLSTTALSWMGDGRKLGGLRIRASREVSRVIQPGGDGKEFVVDTKGKPVDEFVLDVAGGFVAIGSKPKTEYLTSGSIEIGQKGYVISTGAQTSMPGVFAAGEVTDAMYRQAATAAGSGVQAAIDAEKWLNAVGRSTAKQADRSAFEPHAIPPERPIPPPLPPFTARDDVEAMGCRDFVFTCLKAFVDAHDVVIFSKTWCPYCDEAKQLVRRLELADVKIIELDTAERGSELLDLLEKTTERRKVPNIFVQGRCVGGSEGLEEELPILQTLRRTRDK